MRKIRVLVADDEPLARRGVCQLLAPHEDLVVVAETRNGQETLRAVQQIAPDLLFLDIQMPEMDGFEILRMSDAERPPVVVFVTAHDQFAVRAFEERALDYLVKPLNVQRFEATLHRVRDRLRSTRVTERLVVSTAAGKLVIPVADIDWIGAEDYYACLHIGPKTHLLREPLTSLEARLDPACFVRVHRSAIIQLNRVRELRASGIVLQDGSRIPVSRRRRAMLDEFLMGSPGGLHRTVSPVVNEK
jgi:two-component system LytT family response regulator